MTELMDSAEMAAADEVEAPKTYRDFFADMQEFTFVTNGYSTYIFVGIGYEHESESGNDTKVKLLHSRYMAEEVLSSDLMSMTITSEWSVVMDHGEPKVADTVLRMALRHLGSYRGEISANQKTIDQLQESFTSAVKDLKTINTHINAYADSNGMCRDYERRIFSWNDGVNGQDALTFKLQGRPQTYSVPVHISALALNDMYVDVEATSDAMALEIVKQMTYREIVLKLAQSYNYSFNEAEIRVGPAPAEDDDTED